MAYDRNCFLVLEESLPEGTIAEHRRSRHRYARPMARSAQLVRPRRGRVIAGVCAALARRFDMKPWQVRLIFVLSCLLPGPQLLIYVALWLILPAE
jgi:phage shock protein PspC (stress-responsive transcriptional regulator)